MIDSGKIAGFLVILTPSEIAGKIPFFFGHNIIGRSNDKATVVIKDISISQKHANLYVSPNRVTITDIGSKNGIKINGEENFIEKNKEVVIDESMIIFLAEVKCKLELALREEQIKSVQPAQKKVEANSKRNEMLRLSEDIQPEQDKAKNKTSKNQPQKKAIKDEYQKSFVSDDFNIEDRFPIKDSEQVKGVHKKNQSKKIANKSLQLKQGKQNSIEPKQQQKKLNIKEVKIEQKGEKSDKEGNKAKKETKDQQTVLQVVIIEEDELSSKHLLKVQPKKEQKRKSPSRSPVKKPKKESPQIKQEKRKSPSKGNKVSKGPEKSKKEKVQDAKEPPLRKSQRNSKQKERHQPPKLQSKKQGIKKEKQIKQDKRQNQNKDEKNKEKSKEKFKAKSKEKSKETQKSVTVKGQNKQRASLDEKDKMKRKKAIKQEDTQMSHSTTIKSKKNRKRMPSSSLEHETGEPLSKGRIIPVRKKKILVSGFAYQLSKKIFLAISDPSNDFDYLIMREYSRTFKALLAICRGVPIVKSEWVTNSQHFGQVINYEQYKFNNCPQIYEAINKAKNGDLLFKGYEFMLVSKEYHLKTEEIEMLVQAGGGQMIKKSKELSKSKRDSSHIAIVRNKEKKHIQQFENDVKYAKKLGFDKIYTIELVLDACQKQQIDWKNNDASKLL